MKKLLALLIVATCFTVRSYADEGMWLLTMLEKFNGKDMKEHGLRISPQDIYNANGSSLKDAIVIFGGGCTGEIVSKDGLLFTNHHCGYGNIQSLSSVDNDYLKYGFWAMNRGEELPAPGLMVRFIRHIEDVTGEVLKGIDDNITQTERDAKVNENIQLLSVASESRYPGMEIWVRDFFGGNQYLMFAIEVYRDVRLVGAPPASIGKFGGDTDNWMWPRHTGDFSVFRVYADENGRPAEYSKDNVPYQAPVHLTVSLKGYEENDFAMIMGFPGSTNRYMTTYEIDQMLNVDNPNRIHIRGVRQDILSSYMEADDQIRIQYSDKYANSSNYWKNSIGKSRGVVKLNVRGQKEEQQTRFTQWVSQDASRAKYSKALPLIEEAIENIIPYSSILQILQETMLIPTEILTASSLQGILTDESVSVEERKERALNAAAPFYKDYNEEVDKAVAKAMFSLLVDYLPESVLSKDRVDELLAPYNGSIDVFVENLYERSNFSNPDKFTAYVASENYENGNNDPAFLIRSWVVETYNANRVDYQKYNEMFRHGHRLFIAGLLEMEKDQNHYPDANFTIRLTYGNVLPYSPADGVIYNFYTNLRGVMEKEDLSNPTEFYVPEKLKELYYAKDFGRYEYRGDVPVAFLSNNDITGGNSGSPVLNGDGHLIGLAFDGNWEAMSGDIAFEPELQRTINVDVRYVLFIIDKFAGAGYLLDEMTIVE